MKFEFFDPTQDVYVHFRKLPHWEQAGATYFITWRTIDSIPRATICRWRAERAVWLRKQGIDPLAEVWRERLHKLPLAARRDYHERFTSPWMECLDECQGACVLKQPGLSAIVARSLKHFDGQRYVLGDFVVMPNHVHVLVQLPREGDLKPCCKSWKHYTARRINQILASSGRFWQVESFDHLVRSSEQFEYLRGYIARNGPEAKLAPTEYHYYRCPM
ncbi:MAG TPA: transposase [Pirellulaceae bacterium]|nr:transposase [Pirellulaceae bacterium]